MSVLTEEVKRIANKLDAGYLRAISLEDFNERIRQIDLTTPLVVLLNVPEIDNTGFESHTSIISNVKLELLFIKKNFDPDDDGEIVQTILDDMELIANNFYDNLRVSTVIAQAVKPDGFSLIGGDTHKISDEVATGWLMTVTVPMDRKVTDCT
jgi:hypothetical protein